MPIAELAYETLTEVRRRCRAVMGGFRPDLALVASALLHHAARIDSVEHIVAAYWSQAMDASRAGHTASLSQSDAVSATSASVDSTHIGVDDRNE